MRHFKQFAFMVLILSVVLTLGTLLSAKAAPSLGSDFLASTEDGKKILCKSDGTWRIASQSDMMATKLMGNTLGTAGNPNIDPLSPTGNPLAPGGASAGQMPGAYSGGANSGAIPSTSLINIVRGDTAFDFRKIKWGMSIAAVKASETARLTGERDGAIEYLSTLNNIDCTILYEFANNGCTKASYIITQDYTDPEAFYADFEKLTGFMSKIYATPKVREYNWKNEMYKQDKNKWGFAISIGFLSCHVIWQTSKIKIDLSMTGGKHKFNTAIVYSKI